MTAATASSNLVNSPQTIFGFRLPIFDLFFLRSHNRKSKIENQNGAVAERLMHFTVYEDDDGSSPFSPAKFFLRLDS